MGIDKKISLNIPPTIGDAPKDALANLNDRFPTRSFLHPKARTNRPESNLTKDELRSLDTITAPIKMVINDYFQDAYGYAPLDILTDFETGTVYPGEAQRGGRLHIDANSDGLTKVRKVLVSDVLPTLYLVGNDLTSQEQEEWSAMIVTLPDSRSERSTEINIAAAEEGISAGKLAMYAPRERSLVLADEHVHQSPTNTSSDPVNRTWMRFFVIDH